MKRLILIFLSFVFAFVLISCGECKFTDENGDGICDECGEGDPRQEKPSDGIELPEIEF